jgi:hypothetical protein
MVANNTSVRLTAFKTRIFLDIIRPLAGYKDRRERGHGMKPLLSLIAFGCAILLSAQTQPRTLREVLAADGMTVADGTLPNLDKPVTSGSSLNDPARYVLAYYLDDGAGVLRSPMFIDAYDRKARTWESAAVTGGGSQINAAGASMSDDVCLGSVLRIQASAESIFLDTHINPSAGCLLILSQDLKVRKALFGWYIARFSDDSVVYQRGEVHFAPVHPSELALYNWRSGREVELFPIKPFQAIRLAHIQRLREFFSTRREWCNKNNDPCDPEQMDSTLLGDVATNDSEHTLAFLISYEQLQGTLDEQKPSGPGKVVYVIRHADDPARLDYREILLADVEARFGNVTLADLLETKRLGELFGGR